MDDFASCFSGNTLSFLVNLFQISKMLILSEFSLFTENSLRFLDLKSISIMDISGGMSSNYFYLIMSKSDLVDSSHVNPSNHCHYRGQSDRV